MKEYKYLNRNKLEKIFQNPLWYFDLEPFLTEHFWEFHKNKDGKPKEWFEESEEFEYFVNELLNEGKVALNDKKLGMDIARKPVDSIIIHHSSRPADEDIMLTANSLSLIRIYAKDFADKKQRYYGKPITSDHFYQDKMVFVPYHYIIWPDGKVVNFNEDKTLLWHCGNWDYNCRSIAICFHSELENAEPTADAIKSAKEIIKKYNVKEVLGHREVSDKTTCPGDLFLGEKGWKKKLLED